MITDKKFSFNNSQLTDMINKVFKNNIDQILL